MGISKAEILWQRFLETSCLAAAAWGLLAGIWIAFHFPPQKQECVFEIVGIFHITREQEIGPYTAQRQMLQNWVFVDSRTLLPYLNGLLESVGMPSMGYEKVTFSVPDSAEMESVIRKIKDNTVINWTCFKLETDAENYQSAEAALAGMDGSVRVMILVLLLSGMAILVLLLWIQAKFRVRETGVMLALGLGKREILAQRMAETGCGKTTLLSLLGGLDSPSGGQILYQGEDIAKIGLARHRRSHTAFIFQGYNLIDYLTPAENVALTSVQPPLPILERLGLTKAEARRSVLKLSGGQQQRVAIARALASDARVILADEPTGNLDEDTAAEITAILRDSAHKSGKCVVVVTHSGRLAKEADVVFRLRRGELRIADSGVIDIV